MCPRCSKRISVRPSPRSVSTTMTTSGRSAPGVPENVSTSRSGAATSRYSPVQRISRRAAPQNIVARQVPPGRTSIATVESGTSQSAPPNQSAKRSGSVHSRHTRSREASKTRVVVKPPSEGVRSGIVSQPLVEAVEARLPEPTVALEPLGGVLERDRPEPRRAQLRAAPPLDQAGALEHAQMLADGLGGDGERRGELVDRGLALDEAREDRPPGGVGEGGEGGGERVDGHGAIKPVGLLI